MSDTSKRSESAVIEEAAPASVAEQAPETPSAESAPADESMVAKVKLAELNAVLLRTRLQASKSAC